MEEYGRKCLLGYGSNGKINVYYEIPCLFSLCLRYTFAIPSLQDCCKAGITAVSKHFYACLVAVGSK